MCNIWITNVLNNRSYILRSIYYLIHETKVYVINNNLSICFTARHYKLLYLPVQLVRISFFAITSLSHWITLIPPEVHISLS